MWNKVKQKRKRSTVKTKTPPITPTTNDNKSNDPFKTSFASLNESLSLALEVKNEFQSNEMALLEKILSSLVHVSNRLDQISNNKELETIATQIKQNLAPFVKQSTTLKKFKQNHRLLKKQLANQVPSMLELPQLLNSAITQSVLYFSSDIGKVAISDPIPTQMLPLTIQQWVSSIKPKYDELMHSIRMNSGVDNANEEAEGSGDNGGYEFDLDMDSQSSDDGEEKRNEEGEMDDDDDENPFDNLNLFE